MRKKEKFKCCTCGKEITLDSAIRPDKDKFINIEDEDMFCSAYCLEIDEIERLS